MDVQQIAEECAGPVGQVIIGFAVTTMVAVGIITAAIIISCDILSRRLVQAVDIMGQSTVCSAAILGRSIERGLASHMTSEGAGAHIMARGMKRLSDAVADREPLPALPSWRWYR